MELIIKNYDKRIDAIKEINRICDKNKEHVFILGGVHTAEVISRYLKDNGLLPEIQYMVDDEYITEDDIEKGVCRVSEYLAGHAASAPLVFGFYNYEIILKKKEKYAGIVRYMFDFHITVVNDIRVEWNVRYLSDNYNAFNTVYRMLCDDKSRQVMQCYLNAAAAGEFHDLFVECHEKVPYFGDVLENKKIDRLFDCGAFDGDSIHDFVGYVDSYKKIYAFEPDKNNVLKIKQRIQEEKLHDVSIIEKGVWSETTVLHFMSEGKSSSHISADGDISIEVMRLDDMYDEIKDNCLIKMDIEGSELRAIEGAKRIIAEKLPYLAICVYHKREDLITIPKYIETITKSGSYDFYLRYQGLDLAELVLFAIPKEKRRCGFNE